MSLFECVVYIIQVSTQKVGKNFFMGNFEAIVRTNTFLEMALPGSVIVPTIEIM